MTKDKVISQETQVAYYQHKRRISLMLKVALLVLIVAIVSIINIITLENSTKNSLRVFFIVLFFCGLGLLALPLPISCIMASRTKKSFFITMIFWLIGVTVGVALIIFVGVHNYINNEVKSVVLGILGGLTGMFLGISTIVFIIQSIVFVNKKTEIDLRAKQARKKIVILDDRNAQKDFTKKLKTYSLKKQTQEFIELLDSADARFQQANLPYNTVAEAKEMLNKIVIDIAILDGNAQAKFARKQVDNLWETRNHKQIALLKEQCEQRLEQRKNEVLSNVTVVECPEEYNGESKFDGNILAMLGWALACFFVNLFTLNIARPFTACWKQRWIAKHTVIDGKRLSFDGNGLQLFGKWIVWLLLTVVTLGIYGFVVGLRFRKWIAQHTHVAGECADLGGTFDGTFLQNITLGLLTVLVNIFTLFIARPFTMCMRLNWQTRHTVNDGRRLRFDGNGLQLLGKWIVWLLLTVVTLGIYTIFLSLALTKWKTSHTHFTEKQEIVM